MAEMTRCECAGLPFEEIARIGQREGIEEVELLTRRTGCAGNCTACRPDLERFLARGRSEGAPLASPVRWGA